MAKRQTRRSISVSRSTYERLRAYCETNGISMSQFVETRVGDFLGRSTRRPGSDDRLSAVPVTPAVSGVPGVIDMMASTPATSVAATRLPPVVMSPAAVAPATPVVTRPVAEPAPRPAPAPAPPVTKLKPEQIFTF